MFVGENLREINFH